MNSTWERLDNLQDAIIKNFMVILLGIIINYINGTLVFIFFTNQIFYTDPKYILYIHMVINDIIMLCLSVSLYVVTYISPFMNVSVCCIILIIADTTHKNTPLNLAGMAIERYIAICDPLRHSQICTVRRTYVLIAVIWGVGALPVMIDFVIALSTRQSRIFSPVVVCFTLRVFNTPYHKDKNTGVQAVYLSAVWLTLIYTYFRVLFAARVATTNAGSARKAQNTILLHSAQVMLCMLSYIHPLTDRLFLQWFPKERTNILFISFMISNILPRLLSPLIYGIRDKKLLNCMKRYVKCKLYAVKVRPTQAQSSLNK